MNGHHSEATYYEASSDRNWDKYTNNILLEIVIKYKTHCECQTPVI